MVCDLTRAILWRTFGLGPKRINQILAWCTRSTYPVLVPVMFTTLFNGTVRSGARVAASRNCARNLGAGFAGESGRAGVEFGAASGTSAVSTMIWFPVGVTETHSRSLVEVQSNFSCRVESTT